MLLDEILTPNYFTVEIDGIQNDRFFACEGLEMATKLCEIEEGGLNTAEFGTRRNKKMGFV